MKTLNIKWRDFQRDFQDLSKPKRKFISQIIYGIQASRDVKLSNISRALGEEIPLIKTENRLSRNMHDPELGQHINRRLIEDAKYKIRKETVLALDLTDINKPYAKKMENLAKVWNGSKKEIGNGYWICEVIAAEVDGEELIPLYSNLYSQIAEDFEGENTEPLKSDRYSKWRDKGQRSMGDRSGRRQKDPYKRID